MISFRTGAGLLVAFVWLPRPRKEKVEVRFCCCCAPVLLLQTLVPSWVPCCPPPRHVPPNCHPAARAQSGFSLWEEAAFWDVQKEHPPLRARCPGALVLWLDCRSRYGRCIWTGACYWHGVGGSRFNSSSSSGREDDHWNVQFIIRDEIPRYQAASRRVRARRGGARPMRAAHPSECRWVVLTRRMRVERAT